MKRLIRFIRQINPWRLLLMFLNPYCAHPVEKLKRDNIGDLYCGICGKEMV